MGIADVEREENKRYDDALAILKTAAPNQLPTLGLTKWRPVVGEDHLIDPQTIYLLQRACQQGDYDLFQEYSAHVHRAGRAVRLRDLRRAERDPAARRWRLTRWRVRAKSCGALTPAP